MADEAPLLAAGAFVAYGLRVLEHLNRSKHCDVYKVLDETSGLQRVAKVLRPDCATEESIARLRHESERVARLRHPCIMKVIRPIDRPPGTLLELLPGTTLRETLRHRRALAWPEVARLGAHLASALTTVHRAGLMHCDLKPANIFAAPGRYVLLDFDLARAPGRTGGGLGTRLYNAPEQAAGGELGPAVDTWGLGVVLFRAATGRLPFESDDGDPQVDKPAPRVRIGRPGGGELSSLIDAMLHPSPAGRPLLAWLELELPRLERVLRASDAAAPASRVTGSGLRAGSPG